MRANEARTMAKPERCNLQCEECQLPAAVRLRPDRWPHWSYFCDEHAKKERARPLALFEQRWDGTRPGLPANGWVLVVEDL